MKLVAIKLLESAQLIIEHFIFIFYYGFNF
jgi:hypothetical protein